MRAKTLPRWFVPFPAFMFPQLGPSVSGEVDTSYQSKVRGHYRIWLCRLPVARLPQTFCNCTAELILAEEDIDSTWSS